MSSLSIQAMRKMSRLCLFFFSLLSLFSTHVFSSQNQHPYQAKYLDGSSQLVDLEYHMGPVVTSPINLYTIWYGHWEPSSQAILRDFLFSLSSPSPSPSVADWWHTVSLYTDQTGSNITRSFTLAGEHYDSMYSHGMRLTRLAMQSIIKSATSAYSQPLPLDTHNGIYLVLTSSQVQVQDFCREVCGFHHFTFPSIVGATVPYAWIGHSGVQCPGICAYPFAPPDVGSSGNASGSGVMGVMGAPNGDAGTDGMVSVIGHELAEMASNPLINAWYAGGDPTAPTEIADLCVGVYGSGGGGGFAGSVNRSLNGEGYNLNGVRGRKFLVQWLWNPARKSCFGPNAVN